MDLPATSEGPSARKELEKPAAILQNVLGLVFIETGETQRVLWHVADAAEAGRETVDETVPFEWGANERAHTINLAPVEAGCC